MLGEVRVVLDAMSAVDERGARPDMKNNVDCGCCLVIVSTFLRRRSLSGYILNNTIRRIVVAFALFVIT
jgi:hypothetical protein